jgi:hypothetical protein
LGIKKSPTKPPLGCSCRSAATRAPCCGHAGLCVLRAALQELVDPTDKSAVRPWGLVGAVCALSGLPAGGALPTGVSMTAVIASFGGRGIRFPVRGSCRASLYSEYGVRLGRFPQAGPPLAPFCVCGHVYCCIDTRQPGCGTRRSQPRSSRFPIPAAMRGPGDIASKARSLARIGNRGGAGGLVLRPSAGEVRLAAMPPSPLARWPCV